MEEQIRIRLLRFVKTQLRPREGNTVSDIVCGACAIQKKSPPVTTGD
jgi:hypothetical protein